MKVLLQHVQAEPVPPSQRTELPIPQELDDLVLACLRKDPNQAAAERRGVAHHGHGLQDRGLLELEPREDVVGKAFARIHRAPLARGCSIRHCKQGCGLSIVRFLQESGSYTLGYLNLEGYVRSFRSSVACVMCVACLSSAAPASGQTQAQQPPSDSHSFAGFFKSTLNDFRRLPSQESLTWLTIGAAVAATGQTKDWDVTNGFSRSRMRGIFDAGETIGGARAQMAGALATYAIGRASGPRERRARRR